MAAMMGAIFTKFGLAPTTFVARSGFIPFPRPHLRPTLRPVLPVGELMIRRHARSRRAAHQPHAARHRVQ